MDNIQLWLYIIIGGIYFVSRVMKKSRDRAATEIPTTNKQRPQRRFEPTSTTDTSTERPLTFEELLREITEGKTPKRPQPVPKPITTSSKRQEYVDYDDDVTEEEEDLEDVNYNYRNQDDIYKTYEDAKKMAFSRASLEETGIGESNIQFGKFKVFEEEDRSTVITDIVKEFGSGGGLRKAVIMSEILKPKF